MKNEIDVLEIVDNLMGFLADLNIDSAINTLMTAGDIERYSYRVNKAESKKR